MAHIKPPGPLTPVDLDIGELDLWLEAFDDYTKISHKASLDDDDMLRSLLLATAGLEIRRIVNGLTLADKKYTTLREALRSYFCPVKNVVLERHRFFNARQDENESLSAYLVRLKTMSDSCNFTDNTVDTVPNQMIRDQYIRGMSSVKIAEQLLSQRDLTLAKAIEIAEGMAQAGKDVVTMG